jgi:acetoin utilization deacetylase AcuC-like enzyme
VTAPTGFYLHPAASLHDPGWGHPEHQGRLRALASTVGRDLLALHGHVEQRECPEATEEDLLRVHGAEHVRRVRDACAAAEVQQKAVALDPDTKVSGASWEAALGSAGAAMAAAAAVADGELASAFVATRPPGHHATRHRAMGFCLFNNVAVAARYLQATDRAERVLIVDWDVHHGNGTQDAFYQDASVFYLSVHQAPHYPGTGHEAQTGEGDGKGYTLNVPLPAGTARATYGERFRDALGESVRCMSPDFVLVSCGLDCLADDPLGGFLLEPVDLYRMTREVMEQTSASSEGRVVALLEGGYNPSRVGTASVFVIRALAGLDCPDG